MAGKLKPGVTYDGPVCYLEGWHYSVVPADVGEEPGQRLVLNEDGSYTVAGPDDQSWHDRKHQRFASIVPEDGSPGLRVTSEELAEIQKLLDQRRKGAE